MKEVVKELRDRAYATAPSQVCPVCEKVVDIEQPYAIIKWLPNGRWKVGRQKVTRTFHLGCCPLPIPS